MIIKSNNDPQEIYDKHFPIRCPHCGVQSNITAISVPDYAVAMRFQLPKLGIAYFCNNCHEPVFMKFPVGYNGHQVGVDETKAEEIERPLETFEYRYLPIDVASDFREALTSYSNLCYQAFAAMCRRTVQSAFEMLGAQGKDRVIDQLKEIRETANLDDETYEIFQQIIIAGHDGAHPHLPRLSPERAGVLLELMKDVMYQLFVRQAKIQEAIRLRKQDRANKTD